MKIVNIVKGRIILILLFILVVVIMAACSSSSKNVELDPGVEQSALIEEAPVFRIDLVKRIEKNSELPIAYEDYIEVINDAGPPKDGIPPIDNPIYDDIDDADEYLNEDDYVFVYEYDSQVYAFAQKIMVYHEIVNLNHNNRIHSITYCPLTGSAIGYENMLEVEDKTLGTSGSLLNSNLVMYDRASESYWPQILGEAVNGEHAGFVLDSFPVHWVLWKDFKAVYKDAKVLTMETGHIRNYEEDPYGSYKFEDIDNYYHNESIWFHVMNKDTRLNNKSIVTAVKYKGKEFALEQEFIKGLGYYKFSIEEKAFIAVYDKAIDVIRIFDDRYDLSVEGKSLVDKDGKMSWSISGKPEAGTDRTLESPTYFDVYWFAWVAYYPDTGVIWYDE